MVPNIHSKNVRYLCMVPNIHSKNITGIPNQNPGSNVHNSNEDFFGLSLATLESLLAPLFINNTTNSMLIRLLPLLMMLLLVILLPLLLILPLLQKLLLLLLATTTDTEATTVHCIGAKIKVWSLQINRDHQQLW